MEYSLEEEWYGSLKDELREVEAQINVLSKELVKRMDQKKAYLVSSYGD